MGIWHESRPKRPGGICRSDERDRCLLVCIQYPQKDVEGDVFRIYAEQWIGEGPIENWLPQGWVEWWPKTPIVAHDFQEARGLQIALMEQLLAGIDEEQFEKRLPTVAFVEAIEHPSGKWLARIYQHQDGRWEVEFLRWSEGGRASMWVRTSECRDTVTYASDLDSAREAAHTGLAACEAQAP